MGATSTPSVDVRRARERMRTRTDWLDSRHSFSFGSHYDPENTHFGLLMVNNEDVVAVGGGYDTHAHRDMEIVTWVLAGSLMHEDSSGHTGIVRPGLAQRMSAGSGILHSERAASADQDVHFVQMWVVPDGEPVAPGHEQRDISAALDSGGLVVVASGMARHAQDRAVSIRQAGAALHAARLRPGEVAAVPVSPLVHLFLAKGSVDVEATGPLGTGDAARVTGGDGQRFAAGPTGAEVLVWEMHASLA